MVSSEQVGAGGRETWFATTHWTVVLAAGGQESPEAAQALETLCRTYWYALLAWAPVPGLWAMARSGAAGAQ